MTNSRRNFLLSLLAIGGGLIGYSTYRGVRLPTLHWDPKEPSNNFELSAQVTASGTNLIQTSKRDGADARLRAFAPEPVLSITPAFDSKVTIEINNISPLAVLNSSHPAHILHEQKSGITRRLELDLMADKTLELQWEIPNLGAYKFASIGDSGGDQELAWCLQRAEQLGALFLLHLGDFNYQAGDYQRSIDLFGDSNIPVYVSIGNHDFHEDGAIYGSFTREIGPLNHSFTLGNTRFINVDTAANFVPYGSGARGKMLTQLHAAPAVENTVAYTHCPLYDPDPERHHDMGSEGEKEWLIAQLKALNTSTLLSGHIHIYDQRSIDGIENIIVGQGLGHQDLLTNSDYSKIALGHVDTSGTVTFSIEPLSMPMEMHCHPRTNPVKQSLKGSPHHQLIEEVEASCSDTNTRGVSL